MPGLPEDEIAKRVAVGDAIRNALNASGHGQRWLAAQLGVSQTRVSDWCRGKSLPTPVRMGALERALGLQPNVLAALTGYVPVSVPIEFGGVLDAIDRDPRLTPGTRYIVRATYLASVEYNAQRLGARRLDDEPSSIPHDDSP